MNEKLGKELHEAVKQYNSVQENAEEHISSSALHNQLVEAADDEVEKVIQDLKAKCRQNESKNEQ